MIIVTGANGFIGSAIVWELNQRGLKDIVCVDTVGLDTRDLLKKRQYSLFLKKDELWKFLDTDQARNSITWIIHMGACSTTTENDWNFLQENNVDYTRKIFEWCTQYGKSMIYASSAATYGAGENGFDDVTDSEKLKPLNLYGDSKVIFDRWALKQNKTPPNWYGLKFFNVFGPNEYHKESMTSVAYKAFHQIQKNNSLGLFVSHNADYQDGEQMRDFVYVKDVTSWIFELTEKKPQNGIYNMGFGKARTWLDLARGVFTAMGKEMKINWLELPANLRDQYQYFTEAKMTKWQTQHLSGPKWSVEKATDDYIKNYLANGDSLL